MAAWIKQRRFSWWSFAVRLIGILLLVLAALVALVGSLWSYGAITIKDLITNLWPNIATDLMSTAITILVLDYFFERRADEQKKAELIRDLGSKTNDFALRAARELRARGWHKDGTLAGAYLPRANLTDATLWGADLTGAYLEDANLTRAALWGGNLTRARLDNADLTDANLVGATLKRVVLTNANLTDADLADANLVGATLAGANLTRARLDNADLTDAFLAEANLTGANLEDANLTNAELWGANLTRVDLGGVNLTHARLFGANLTYANLKNTNLVHVYCNNATQWPEDFDPKAAGAINVDEQKSPP